MRRRGMPSWGKSKLSLEEYARFFHDVDHRRSFSVHQLNFIVAMHGFLKLTKHKDSILEALGSVDLLRPTRRSTVQDRAKMAAAATLTLEEVKRDVVALGWEDCFLGSVVSVEPGKEALPKAATDSASVSKRRLRGGGEGRGVSRKRLLSATTVVLSLAATPAE